VVEELFLRDGAEESGGCAEDDYVRRDVFDVDAFF
jgi:hypothetical protein